MTLATDTAATNTMTLVRSLLKKAAYWLGVSTACLAIFIAPACADENWIISQMRNAIRADVTWEQVRSQMLTAFYRSNPDERGVSARGIENLRRIAEAQRRSQVISQILHFDLDGDGSVTREEITEVMQPRARQMINANGVQLVPTPEQVRIQLDKLVAEALKPDADHDGVISAAEIQQEAARLADQSKISWQQNIFQYVPMTLDADGDGVVSLAEYEAAIRKQFDLIDQDHDGRISATEALAASKRSAEAQQAIQRTGEAERRAQQLKTAAAGCNVPSVPRDVRFVLVGGGEGRALSSAWIGSQDRTTAVATVEINPGSEPLYLVLASEGAMIWDVRGATDRLVGLVAHSNTATDRSGDAHPSWTAGAPHRGKPLVGVMGVPVNKIHFSAYTGCLVPPTQSTLKDGSAQEAAAVLFGRTADEIDGKVSVGSFTVPAIQHFPDRPIRNAMQLPKEGPGELLWKILPGDYPEGVAQIDIGSVISPLPVKNYSILPGSAGLARLVDEGALVITGTSRAIRINFGDYQPFTSVDSFRITRKLRLPAGVTEHFVLDDNVPPPDGDLSGICVSAGQDKKPVEGSRNNCN
jgi:Ca2+-binding EF-hand superfamily protein